MPNKTKQSSMEYELPFERDTQYQELKPHQKDYLLSLRNINEIKRLKIIDAKQALHYILIIRKAYEQLEEIRKKSCDKDNMLEVDELIKISDKSLSVEKRRQIQIIFKELQEKKFDKENFDYCRYIRLSDRQIRVMERNYLKAILKSDNEKVDFFQILITSDIDTRNTKNRAFSYLAHISTSYRDNEKVYFNGRVSRSLCYLLSSIVGLVIIPGLYTIMFLATEHPICGYYKCDSSYFTQNGMQVCSNNYYRSLEQCQVNEITKKSFAECKNTCNQMAILKYVPAVFLGCVFLFFSARQIALKRICSEKYFNKLKEELEKKANTPIAEKLTIVTKKPNSSSNNCFKRFIGYHTIVELSDGSKISKFCGCIEDSFTLNINKISYILKGYFDWMFCAKPKKVETSKNQIVELIVSNLKNNTIE